MNVKLENVEIVEATCLRIPFSQREAGLFYYDVRNDEVLGIPYTVEHFVFINYLGTIITKEPIPMSSGYLTLNEDDRIALFEVLLKAEDNVQRLS